MGDFNIKNTTQDSQESQPQAPVDTQRDYDYALSDNVVEDLVEYTRSKTVKNEQQFVLTTLGYISGFMESPKHYVSGVLIGTAGSGKSHLQNTVAELFSDDVLYDATSGSDKSIIYDRKNWNAARVGNLDELQKPSEEIIEILKGVHGGEDEVFVYKVTGGGKGAEKDTDEIELEAMPYWFLYAQYEPDFEMWDRLIKIPVHESKEKNDGVARTQWDHQMISFTDTDENYMFPFEEGEAAIKDHIADLPMDSWVKIPAGEDEFGWDAYEYAKTMFDISRSETNRVSSQIANLVRASALLNHKNREKRRMHIHNQGTKDGVIIAEPQDVANILACRETLLATTHQLDRKRKAICVAIEEVSSSSARAAPIKHPKDRTGQPKSIMGYLRNTDASFVKRPEIEAMLQDLQDNGLVEKLDGAGDNGRNLYQFQSWQNLGKFNINDSFKETFKDSEDPFDGGSFIETARRINDEMTPSAGDFHSDNEVTSSSDSEGQATLGGVSEETIDVDLAVHEELAAQMLRDNLDGETIDNLDEHEPSIREMLGIVELGADDDSAEIGGTILDPEHAVWEAGPEDWVTTVAEAESEVENAMRTLTQEGIFQTSTTETRAGQPIAMKVKVKDV